MFVCRYKVLKSMDAETMVVVADVFLEFRRLSQIACVLHPVQLLSIDNEVKFDCTCLVCTS